MPGTAVSFDSHDMQTANIITQEIDHHSGPSKNNTAYPLAHANYSKVPFVNYPGKPIPVTGEIVGSSLADLDSRIDAFKAYFNVESGNLDIGYNGGTRRYLVSPGEPDIKRPGGLFYANYTILFTCLNPFGMDTSTSSISGGFSPSATGRTLGAYNDVFTFLGSAPFQAPIFTYTLTAFTGTNPLSVTFGNASTGQTITVNRTWVAGDILVIDTTPGSQSVKVNGTEIDFTGAFPYFAPGSQTINYTDGFTTRTFTVSVVYTPMYK